MKYVDEFRRENLARRISAQIKKIMPEQEIKLMEVCGSHTQGFHRFGLGRLLPKNLKFISGPGCPVCVSSQGYIDQAINLAKSKNNIIVTFGDMLRIPGTDSTLENERAQGGSVQVVYSALDSLGVAQNHPDKKVIFLAVGFETTAPTIGLSIISAKRAGLKNLFFYSALKLIPPAMGYLAQDKKLALKGFLCPGHVSAVIGTLPYTFIPRKYGLACCVCGFEPVDILEGIYLLIRQIRNRHPQVENQYLRAVTTKGNLKAKMILEQVFGVSDACWRGLGEIPKSGLKIRKEFSQFDAEREFILSRRKLTIRNPDKCLCADILKGLIPPPACPLFGRLCNPEHPVGPCMVSNEGACSVYYRYR
jgi:hydrogenase expression/formation protein HypD